MTLSSFFSLITPEQWFLLFSAIFGAVISMRAIIEYGSRDRFSHITFFIFSVLLFLRYALLIIFRLDTPYMSRSEYEIIKHSVAFVNIYGIWVIIFSVFSHGFYHRALVKKYGISRKKG